MEENQKATGVEKVKKPFYKKWWFIVICVVVVCGVIGGIFGEKDKSKPVSGGQSATKVTSAPGGEPETTAEPEKYGPGYKIEGKGWNITLLEAKQYDVLQDDSGNQFMKDEPAEGKVFLALFFEAENTSGEDDYFNHLYFKAYADDYSVDLSIPFISSLNGYSSISADVGAGKKVKGYVTYEVSKDWKEFEITYDDGVWVSNKVATFVVTPSDLS